MAFRGFDKGVRDQLNSYYLPQRILGELFREMEPLYNLEPSELSYDEQGLYFGILFYDPENPGHTYRFDLSCVRNDMDFKVVDVSGFARDENDHVFWETKPTI
ncbi:MAG TPA: hypothetical protein VGK58_15550 [Lacipirellulaceae bacterium]